MNPISLQSLSLCTAGALALAACASTPPPVAEMAAARASVEQAEPASLRYAPQQLRLAKEKLARAEMALAREEHADARRLAEEAEADARLASAMAESERMQRAVAEVNRGIATLKQQVDGGTQ